MKYTRWVFSSPEPSYNIRLYLLESGKIHFQEFLRLVRYLCSCGHLQPLCRLYFCRYCSDLRCGQCVSHEVDSHYCPNCLENMPSAEARLKKNRCANCFDCPSCGHTLSTRATSMTVASQQVEGVDGQPSKVCTVGP